MKGTKISNEYQSNFKNDFYFITLKLETLKTEITQSKKDILKWFMSGFIILFLMILVLFATIVLK
jgi:hypothetical protein